MEGSLSDLGNSDIIVLVPDAAMGLSVTSELFWCTPADPAGGHCCWWPGGPCAVPTARAADSGTWLCGEALAPNRVL